MKGQSIVQVAKINLYNFPWNELKKVWSSRVKINQFRERNVHTDCTADLTFPLKSSFGIKLNEIDFN